MLCVAINKNLRDIYYINPTKCILFEYECVRIRIFIYKCIMHLSHEHARLEELNVELLDDVFSISMFGVNIKRWECCADNFEELNVGECDLSFIWRENKDFSLYIIDLEMCEKISSNSIEPISGW